MHQGVLEGAFPQQQQLVQRGSMDAPCTAPDSQEKQLQAASAVRMLSTNHATDIPVDQQEGHDQRLVNQRNSAMGDEQYSGTDIHSNLAIEDSGKEQGAERCASVGRSFLK